MELMSEYLVAERDPDELPAGGTAGVFPERSPVPKAKPESVSDCLKIEPESSSSVREQ